MITGNIQGFLARCRQRGYTLDEVRPCIVSEDGDQITVDVDHPAYPRTPKPGFTPSKPAAQPPAREADHVSFLQKAKNFAKAAVSHIAAGMPLASDEEIDRRFAICKQCPFLKDNACTKCGCPVAREKKFISKLAWADQKCPEGHW